MWQQASRQNHTKRVTGWKQCHVHRFVVKVENKSMGLLDLQTWRTGLSPQFTSSSLNAWSGWWATLLFHNNNCVIICELIHCDLTYNSRFDLFKMKTVSFEFSPLLTIILWNENVKLKCLLSPCNEIHTGMSALIYNGTLWIMYWNVSTAR